MVKWSGSGVELAFFAGVASLVRSCGIKEPGRRDGLSTDETPIAMKPRGQGQRDRRLQRRNVPVERIKGRIAERAAHIT